MVAAPETLVSAAAQPAAPPAHPTDSQPTNPAKEVKPGGAEWWSRARKGGISEWASEPAQSTAGFPSRGEPAKGALYGWYGPLQPITTHRMRGAQLWSGLCTRAEEPALTRPRKRAARRLEVNNCRAGESSAVCTAQSYASTSMDGKSVRKVGMCRAGRSERVESEAAAEVAKGRRREERARTLPRTNQNGASVNDGAASPGAESASSSAPANLPPAEVARNIPCRFFPLGQCKYGEHCIFSHGIPGTAGSPGVPPSPSVAPQVVNGQQGAQRQEHSLAQASGPNQHQHQHHQQQQQAQQHHFQHTAPQHHQFHPQQISMEQAYAMQAAGMPFYYPEQAGMEYGYAPQVAFGGPQPGYYYPPHFAAAAVQPPFPPQPYYAAGPVAQAPPPPPQVAAAEQLAVSPPPAAVSPAQSSAPATSPSPAEPSASAAEAPVIDAAAAVAPVEAALAAPIDPLAAAAGAAVPPVASLHTFFQTGPPAGMPPALLAGAPNGAPYMRNGVPRGPMGPRRSIGGPNGPIPGPGGKRASFGNARPPCSFFEANRCRHGDKCLFVHLLPDGSDARALGRGLIGIDGRTEHPEATGGMPPAWLATQKAIKAANQTARKHHEQGTILNGGYSYRERMSAQTNAQDQATAPVPSQDANPAAVSQEESVSATPSEAIQQVPVSAPDASAPVPAPIQQQQQQRPIPNGANQRNGPLPPGSAAPQLVAAINGLTRRIPPAHINKQQGGPAGQRQGHQQQNDMHAHHHHQQQHQNNGHKQQQQRKPQRVPSGENDFPALSPAAPSSPAFEKEGFAAALAAPAPTPAAAPAPAAPAPAEKPAPTPVADPTKPTSPSEENEGFVMVSHADAGVPTPADSKAEASSASAPAAPAASPAPAPATAAPRPKLIGGWASAAARGASVVVPEKPKTRAFSPVVVNRSATPAAESKDAPAPVKKEESAPAAAAAKKDSREKVDEDGFVRQQPKRKGGAHKANKAATQHQQPVAIKA
ncbi:hypothetical protein RHOSPDRAFT_23960 [Rhodotorula sp. JG-1b]|nr:hypothetical protein RHOSPDRAFT_23960 [Rhodotorula sp. JG-1b]